VKAINGILKTLQKNAENVGGVWNVTGLKLITRHQIILTGLKEYLD